MAKTFTESEARQTRVQSFTEEALKKREQASQGKSFVNNRQGVLPEEVWQNLPGKRNKKTQKGDE